MPTAPLRYGVGTGASQIAFTGIPFPIKMHNAIPPKVATGYDVSRDSRTDTFSLRFDDWSGGALMTSGIYTVREKNRWFINQGLVAPRPGLLHLPFVSTAQTALDNIDISGKRAANQRGHSIMSWHGVSGMRFLYALGTKIYIDTSLTDPALTLADDALTDTVLSIANLKLNSTEYCAVSTDGTTNDTIGAADVTAGTPFSGGTSLVTHAHADDGFFVMDFLPTFGGSGWNVFQGIINQVNGWWGAKSTASIPLTSSTLIPIVDAATKDQPGTAAAVTLTTVAASGASNTGVGDLGNVTGGGATPAIATPGIWRNCGNITADDAAYVQYSIYHDSSGADAGVGRTSELNIFFDLEAAGLPRGASPSGLVLTLVDVFASDSDSNAYISDVQLQINGSPAGNPGRVVSGGGELANAAGTNIVVGSTTDDWGLSDAVRGKDIKSLGVSIRFAFATTQGSADATIDLNIDYATLGVSYTIPGSLAALPTGGYQWGKPPHEANLIGVVHPVSNELATIFKPRIFTKCKFEYDAEGDRPLVTYTQPPTQMPNVVDGDWFQGGAALAGGPPGGLATQCKLVDNNNVTRDLGFPAVHGTTPVAVSALFARGAFLMAWVANTASTDCQLWYYFDGKWAVYGALFSKTLGGNMSTQPLNWAEKTLNTHQNYIYCVYPTSTNTSVIRQFVPPDLVNADPYLVNTSIVKQNGPLYIQGVIIESLPSEANNSILSSYMQSYQVDNNTSFGSVQADVNVVGDHTFAATAVSHLFDAAAERFTERNVATSGDPGVAFKTTITRITLDHEAGSTETPNGCTWQMNCTSDWDPKYEFGIMLIDRRNRDPANWFTPVQNYPTPYALFDKIHAQMMTKVSQELTEVGVGTTLRKSVKHQPWTLSWRKDMTPGTWEAVEFLALNYLENVGGLS